MNASERHYRHHDYNYYHHHQHATIIIIVCNKLVASLTEKQVSSTFWLLSIPDPVLALM